MITLRDVRVRYSKRNILRDVSFVFSPGLNFIIGLNGSGKTTLLQAVSGNVAYQGSIRIAGKEVRDMLPGKRAAQVSRVYQNLQVPFQVPVYDFVLMGRFPYLDWMGIYSKNDHERVERQLSDLELLPFRARYLDEISGGELQKVMIARALVQDTPVILLDEPAQSLDPLNKERIYALLESLAAQGKCIVCTTHDREPLALPQARIMGLRDGALVFDQAGGEIYSLVRTQVYGAKEESAR